MMVRDLEPNRIVYISLRRPQAAHLRGTCPQIRNKFTDKRAQVARQDMPICRTCRSDYSHSDRMKETTKTTLAKELERLSPEDLGL